MSKFIKGDKVKVTYPSSWYGQIGTVTEPSQGDGAIQIQMVNGQYTRWLPTSLELVERADAPQPFNLTEKQIAVLNAANELREAQIKFTKALDTLNNNQ